MKLPDALAARAELLVDFVAAGLEGTADVVGAHRGARTRDPPRHHEPPRAAQRAEPGADRRAARDVRADQHRPRRACGDPHRRRPRLLLGRRPQGRRGRARRARHRRHGADPAHPPHPGAPGVAARAHPPPAPAGDRRGQRRGRRWRLRAGALVRRALRVRVGALRLGVHHARRVVVRHGHELPAAPPRRRVACRPSSC